MNFCHIFYNEVDVPKQRFNTVLSIFCKDLKKGLVLVPHIAAQ